MLPAFLNFIFFVIILWVSKRHIQHRPLAVRFARGNATGSCLLRSLASLVPASRLLPATFAWSHLWTQIARYLLAVCHLQKAELRISNSLWLWNAYKKSFVYTRVDLVTLPIITTLNASRFLRSRKCFPVFAEFDRPFCLDCVPPRINAPSKSAFKGTPDFIKAAVFKGFLRRN